MTETPDPLAAYITAVRGRCTATAAKGWMARVRVCEDDMPRFIAAVEKVLDAASRWEGHTTAYCADETRMLITRELTGEEPAVDMGYLSLPADVQAAVEAGTGRRGGSLNPTPDCGGPRKPPGATEVWWCGTHAEFHGAEASDG